MSRVGKRIITIPEGVTLTNNNNFVEVKGPLGTLSRQIVSEIKVEINGNEVTTKRSSEEKRIKQLHGTSNVLISNMIEGVSKGFKKELQITGVGYKAAVQGNKITLALGYSHPVVIEIPAELKVEAPKPTELIVSGIDKVLVGQLAADIRQTRKPNVYSGKGVSYKGEHIRRKEGKAAGK